MNLHIENVPIKCRMIDSDILISEAQERMLIVINKENITSRLTMGMNIRMESWTI